MKNLFLIICTFFFVPILVAQKKKTTIIWDENRPLTWKDYKGKVNKNAGYKYVAAMTMGGVSYSVDGSSFDNTQKLVIEVFFVPEQSWVRPKMNTAYILNHEQVHFDIFEIYARILVKKLRNNKNILKGNDYSKKLQKVFDDTYDDLHKLQREYDKATQHSIDEQEQAKWNDKIKKLLIEYQDYKDKVIPF